MKHTSVKLNTPSEFIKLTPINPLISKCQIKVCYVSDKPNRNKSVITKEVAKKIANTIPGTPIVGYYNEYEEDFEEHNRYIDIQNGQFVIKDKTRPYGFVDLNARCWFQKFLDDDEVEREYLMTEGWIWTGQYPESQRIFTEGNNQSMELDKNLINAWWTKDNNGKPMFFIINEAVMSKLCILGTEQEPCFEGANITNFEDINVVSFSLTKDFNYQLQKMKDELTELLNNKKGGAQVFTTYAVTVGDALWTALYSYLNDTYQENYSIDGIFTEGEQKFAVLKDNTAENKYVRLNFSFSESDGFSAEENVNEVEYTPAEEPQFSLSDVETFSLNFKKKDDEGDDDGEKDKDDKSKVNDSDKSTEDTKDSEDDDKKKKKTTYSLDEIVEYQELLTKFSELETKYNGLVEEKTQLESELQGLREFKLTADRKAKEEMINNFYMLDDEAKKDVRENIDKYSLDDIEAKLSILCVRNKVNFNLEGDNTQNGPVTYNLGMTDFDESTPAWVKAVLDTAKTLN